MNVVKPLSQQISVTAANTVSNASLVYIATTASTLVTVAYANTTVKASVVVPANQVIYLDKAPTDTIAANVAVSATSIAYRG